MDISKILVSQPQPEKGKSPYFDLASKNKLQIDFRPFIHVEGIPAKEFRKTRIHIEDYSAVILTSRTAIDHFFRMCEETRFTVPDTMKYLCISEATALYLQKYIVYRKRKIFYGVGTLADLLKVMVKHKKEKFIFPLSDTHKEDMITKVTDAGYNFTKAVMYRTVSSDLSDLNDVNYDMLVFYSPSGIKSLLHNFPDFKQNNTKIAAFGPSTAKAVEEAGLTLDIKAPVKESPSMTMAIERYIKETKK